MRLLRSELLRIGLALCLSLALGHQGVSAADDPGASAHDTHVGIPVPLQPDEKIEYFLNGCGAIVSKFTPEYELTWIRQRNWYGGCRFGLANGRGVIADRDHRTDYDFPLEFLYGYRKEVALTGSIVINGRDTTDFFRSRWYGKTGDLAIKVWEFRNIWAEDIPSKSYHFAIPRDNGFDHYSFNEVQVSCRNVIPVALAVSLSKLPSAHVARLADYCKKRDISSTLVKFLYRTYERTDLTGSPSTAGDLKGEPAFRDYICDNTTALGCEKPWLEMTGKLSEVLTRQKKVLDEEVWLSQSAQDSIRARFAPLEERRESLRRRLIGGATTSTGDLTGTGGPK